MRRGPPPSLMWVCLCLAVFVVLLDLLQHIVSPGHQTEMVIIYERQGELEDFRQPEDTQLSHDLQYFEAEADTVNEHEDEDEPSHEVLDVKDGNVSRAINTYHPRTCDRCFVRNYQYLLNPRNTCQAGTSSVLDLVIIIPSKPSDVWLRNTLRQTWLRITKDTPDVTTRHVFLLGATRDQGLQGALVWEQGLYGDLVQQDFVDSYENLTLKTMMGLEWAVTFCPQAKVVLKADTDVFVNLPRLISAIKKFPGFGSIRGLCQTWSRPMRRSKWAVTYEQYPQEVYPPFCKGTRYFMPMKVARALVEVSPHRPFLRLEDVYLGTCLYDSGYKTWTLGRLSSRLNLNKLATGQTHYDCRQIDRILSSHPVGGKALKYVWELCFKNKTSKAR